MATPPLRIALGLLQQGEEYLLQRRLNDPVRGAAGLIGLYGGKIKQKPKEETAVEAVCREIAEETNFKPDESDALYLEELWVNSDYLGEIVRIHALIFHFEVPDEHQFESREGELVVLREREARQRLESMTPATRACFNRIIFGED